MDILLGERSRPEARRTNATPSRLDRRQLARRLIHRAPRRRPGVTPDPIADAPFDQILRQRRGAPLPASGDRRPGAAGVFWPAQRDIPAPSPGQR